MPADEIILPESLQAASSRPLTWPGVVPDHVLPVLMQNNPALAQKPASLPPHPTIAQTLTATPLGYQFSFNQVVLPIGSTNIISAYRVYRNTSANNFSGATLVRTIVHDPTHQGPVTFQDNTGGAKQYYYFITSVDTTAQESSPQAAQPGAVTSGNANPNVTNAVGSTSSPTTTSFSYATIPEMTQTITTQGNKVIVVMNGSFSFQDTSGFSNQGSLALFRDGSAITPDMITPVAAANTIIYFSQSVSFVDSVSAGSHTYEARWKLGISPHSATFTAIGTGRTFQAIELG